MHMVSWRDEYEAWAVTRGEDGEVDLKNTQEKYVLRFLLKDANHELLRILRKRLYIHTYILYIGVHTNSYSAKNRENESEALAQDD